MATANPTTAIQKKVEVSINDGKTFSEEVFFLHLESVGNVTSEKEIKVKDGEGFSGAFKQIQFRFDKDRNYIYTKNDNNQKEFDEKYKGTALEFSISGLSAGNANTVIRTGRSNSANDVVEKHNGPADRVIVIVETAASLKSEEVIKNDKLFPLGSQTAEYDNNKVRKIYLDSQEKRFETPKKRGIQIRKYQTERDTNVKEEVPTTEYDLLHDDDQRKGKSGPEFIDQEVTGYFRFIENEFTKKEKNGRGTGLAIKLRGGLHPGNKEMQKEDIKKESGKCYEFHFEYNGSNDQCLQKEYPHNNYDKKPKDFDKRFNLPPILGRWLGFKAVTINEDNGVKCEAYLDMDGLIDNNTPANNWKLWYSVLDDGSLFSKDDGTRQPFFSHFGRKRTFFRIDRVDHDPEHKFLSVRSISSKKTLYGKGL
jgi:hypothetical protein